MKKQLILAILAAGLAHGLLADSAAVWKLDASASTLTASALKNESVTVAVKFPVLSGELDPATGKATVTADLKGLETGNPARNTNIETLFFEVAKKAAFGQASFSWKGKPADLAALKVGAPVAVTLTGQLLLHGSKTKLSGPATLSVLDNGSYEASFSDWKLDIKALKLAEPLAAMNKICPQPHRVANEVGLKGDLVFKKQ
jgi:polyisoprenoid-binding protein YceI